MTAPADDPNDFSHVTWIAKPYTLTGPAPLPWSPPRAGTGVRVRCRVDDGFNHVGDEGEVMAWNPSCMRVFWPDSTTSVMAASQLERLEP
jgi:hypothetical protein